MPVEVGVWKVGDKPAIIAQDIELIERRIKVHRQQDRQAGL